MLKIVWSEHLAHAISPAPIGLKWTGQWGLPFFLPPAYSFLYFKLSSGPPEDGREPVLLQIAPRNRL